MTMTRPLRLIMRQAGQSRLMDVDTFMWYLAFFMIGIPNELKIISRQHNTVYCENNSKNYWGLCV
jgi:hypothetical protein